MFSIFASSSLRPAPAVNLLSTSKEQVRNAVKKAGGNKQALASKTKLQQKGFRMKKTYEEKGKEKHDGVFYMQPMPSGRFKDPIFDKQRTVQEFPSIRPEELTENLALGTTRSFGPTATTALKAYGVPRNVLVDFRVLSAPGAVVRDATLRLADRLDKAASSSSQSTRLVLTGSGGTGKSYLLLQSLAYAQSTGYIVLYVPRASKLVDSSTPYSYDPRTWTYAQPKYSHQLLHRLLTVNETSLRKLQLSQDLLADDGSVRLAKGSPLTDLIDFGVRDPAMAPSILARVFQELAEQTQFPVMLAIDDFQSLFCHSTLYRNPKYESIKPYHLSLPRLLLDYASKDKSFKRGAVIAAVSGSNTNWPVTLELQEALGLSTPRPVNEYVKRSTDLAHFAEGLENFAVPEQLTVDEAAAMYELWSKDDALHTGSNDELFLSKLAEASGNARKFVWEGLLQTLAT
ncbi:37S ribosomal protein S23 mitochondrial [Steccherinum ochraceum]|uniref:Small ribosomal subunit protein mS29 n=1 Tax=Steccherinum ochraceum TaxID=92696 RepID=A0A4R0RK93_9APHY|nr:37S ribosomal protein S23 mitochondrial [Steccherinum ochraceum]